MLDQFPGGSQLLHTRVVAGMELDAGYPGHFGREDLEHRHQHAAAAEGAAAPEAGMHHDRRVLVLPVRPDARRDERGIGRDENVFDVVGVVLAMAAARGAHRDHVGDHRLPPGTSSDSMGEPGIEESDYTPLIE